jgi:ABC-type transporter Mla subunit MlaD
MIERAASVVDEADKLFNEMAPQVRESTASFASMVERAEAKWPGWLEQVDGVLADTRAASAKLEPAVSSADAGVAEARKVIASMQETIDANRPGVDRIVANVDKASERVAGPTLDRLDDSLADAQKALEGVRTLAVELGDLIVEQTPSIRKALANVRLASDQLRLVMTEVRSQPWRLLVRPDTKELEQQLLYDSARTYAAAVSDLRAATESLEAVARQSDGAPDLDRQSLADLQARLREAFDDYQKRERDFLDRLIKGQ